jgi:hypothetical protein
MGRPAGESDDPDRVRPDRRRRTARVPLPGGCTAQACGDEHEIWLREAAVDEYARSGLSARHTGRSIEEDRFFFAAALAAGDGLAAATRVEAVR